jgi:hypothetical protein
LKSDLIKGPTSESDEADEPIFRFRFAVREKGYFRIPGRILGVKNDVLIADEGITLDRKLFVAERNVGIFRRIAKCRLALKSETRRVFRPFLPLNLR